MVYQKTLYSRLDPLAVHLMEPQQKHAKIFLKMLHILSKTIGTETYLVYKIKIHPCKPKKQWWTSNYCLMIFKACRLRQPDF